MTRSNFHLSEEDFYSAFSRCCCTIRNHLRLRLVSDRPRNPVFRILLLENSYESEHWLRPFWVARLSWGNHLGRAESRRDQIRIRNRYFLLLTGCTDFDRLLLIEHPFFGGFRIHHCNYKIFPGLRSPVVVLMWQILSWQCCDRSVVVFVDSSMISKSENFSMELAAITGPEE